MRPMKDYPYQMKYKQLLMDEIDEEIHTRWCAKQPLMHESKEGLPIVDEVQNNCWWMRQMKKSIPDDVQNIFWWMRPMKDYSYQMKYKTTVDGWDRWKNPYQMVHETTVDGWDQWRTTRTRWRTNNCWWMRKMESIPDGVENNCWWMGPMKYYPYQMKYKTTVDGSDRWWNPYQMM